MGAQKKKKQQSYSLFGQDSDCRSVEAEILRLLKAVEDAAVKIPIREGLLTSEEIARLAQECGESMAIVMDVKMVKLYSLD